MFLTGLGIFTVSSFASAMAGSAGALFAARAGQGLGAAILSQLPSRSSCPPSRAPNGPGSRCLGRGRRRWCCDRRPRRRRPDRVRLALDLLRQSPRPAAALAIAALKIIPAALRSRAGRASTSAVRCLQRRSLAAIVFAITQGESARSYPPRRT